MFQASCLLIVCAAVVTALPTSLNDERIVNGTDAPAGKYPFQVSYQSNERHSCGGTIINENWIMTAGHCVDGDDVNTISILAGTIDLYGGGGSRHEAAELVLHENFDNPDKIDDIALVRLQTPLVWSDMVAPVTLPAQDQETPAGSDATVIGWGHPYTGGSAMQFLQEVDYWVVSDDDCQAAHTNTIFSTNICGYYPGGGKGQCTGDSGGPLLVNGEQVGVVSWSIKPCAVDPYPGVFTEVSPYINWINDHINARK